MLQHIQIRKKSISKFHFPVKLYEIRKNVIIQYYFLHKVLQIWIVTFFHKMHIFYYQTCERSELRAMRMCPRSGQIFFVSDDSVASYDVHRKATFFRGASGDSLSLAQFLIFCNENLGKYCSNIALLYGNWLNKLTLSVSPKKILKNMPFFTEITLLPHNASRYSIIVFFLLVGQKIHFFAPQGAKHLFYSCDCCPRFARVSNFTLAK